LWARNPSTLPNEKEVMIEQVFFPRRLSSDERKNASEKVRARVISA